MKKKKINLSELRVKSFVTHEEENNILGGASGGVFCAGNHITNTCPESIVMCPHLTVHLCSFQPCGGGGGATYFDCNQTIKEN